MIRYDDARHRPILTPPAASVDVQISQPRADHSVAHASPGTRRSNRCSNPSIGIASSRGSRLKGTMSPGIASQFWVAVMDGSCGEAHALDLAF